jgi:hypothetical protein
VVARARGVHGWTHSEGCASQGNEESHSRSFHAAHCGIETLFSGAESPESWASTLIPRRIWCRRRGFCMSCAAPHSPFSLESGVRRAVAAREHERAYGADAELVGTTVGPRSQRQGILHIVPLHNGGYPRSRVLAARFRLCRAGRGTFEEGIHGVKSTGGTRPVTTMNPELAQTF